MIRSLIAVFVVLSSYLTPAGAVPITYLFSGTASGNLNGTSFSNVLLTVSAAGDTADVTQPSVGLYLNDVVDTTIDIAGVGSVQVTGPDYVFDLQSGNKIGYGVNGIPVCCDIIQFVNAVYGSYDLQSSIGELSFGPNLSVTSWMDVPTSSGLLTVTSFVGVNPPAAAVSEPGALALFAFALAGAFFGRRRRT